MQPIRHSSLPPFPPSTACEKSFAPLARSAFLSFFPSVDHSAASSPVPAEAVFRASALLPLFAHLQPTPRTAAFYKAQFKFPFCKPLCSIQSDWGLQNQMKSYLNPKSNFCNKKHAPTRPSAPFLLPYFTSSRVHLQSFTAPLRSPPH